MKSCDEIKDPSNSQIKVCFPLTEEDKLADLPLHASQPIKLLTIFSLKFASVYKLQIKKHLTLRRLMSCTYGAAILDVSRSHTTTQHSR